MVFVLVEDDVDQLVHAGVTWLHLQPDLEALLIKKSERLLVDIHVPATDIWIIGFAVKVKIRAFSIENAHDPDGGWFRTFEFRRHFLANGRPVLWTWVIGRSVR